MKNFYLILLIVMIFHIRLCYNNQPVVIAHRGASGYLPEQTLESNVMAYIMNSDFIEIDVVLSKDNRVIISHDIILDEITNVRQVYKNRSWNGLHYIRDFTYDELKVLRVTERFTNLVTLSEPRYPGRFPLWKSHFSLTTLDDVIELLDGLHKTYKIQNSNGATKLVGLLIELKRPYYHQSKGANLSEIVLSVLRKYNKDTNDSKIILQSFDPYELIRIKTELKTSLNLVQLLIVNEFVEYEEDKNRINYTYWCSNDGLKEISTFAIGIAAENHMLIDLKDVTAKRPSQLFEMAKNNHLKVFGWTFRKDNLGLIAKTFDELLITYTKFIKIDGIITDFPGDVVSFLNKNSGILCKANVSIILTKLLILLIFYRTF